MKDGHYIGLHTQVRYWLPKGGKYTELEALISHTLDINDNRSWSVNGYSKLWGWSRTKVTSFLHNIKTSGGHHKDIHQDNLKASKGQGIVIKINNFETKEDKVKASERQGERHPEDIPLDTTINNKPKKKKKPKETEPDFILPEWINKEAWDGYVEMRKEKKSPMKTLRAMNLAVNTLKKLKEAGDDPIAILDKSTENSWTGLFPLSNNGKQPMKSKAPCHNNEL